MSMPTKPKPIKIMTLFLVIVAIAGLVAWLIVATRGSSEDPKVGYTGKLISIDTSAMAKDGPGVYRLVSNQELVTVQLDAGESACDRDAIKVPDIKVDETVHVKGEKGQDGIVRVCEAGTYIRK